MGKNQIVLGTMDFGAPLDRAGIRSGRVFMSNSLAADSLGIDTLNVEQDFLAWVPTVFQPQGASALQTADGQFLGVQPVVHQMVANPNSYRYGDIVTYYRDNALFCKMYLKALPLVGKTVYDISCQSAIGILAGEDHYGGVYDGVTVAALLADIIGGLVPYTLDPAFANDLVYGWLPKSSRRNNLHQLLFAIGASVFKDGNGDMYIGALDPNAEYTEIPARRIYAAGGSHTDIPPVNYVTVLEHKYLALGTEEETVLFDGEVPADTVLSPVREPVDLDPSLPPPSPAPWGAKQGTMVVFDGPMHSLRAEGSEILVASDNYAILAPSGACTLYGRPYTHTTRQITRPAKATARLASVNGKEVTVKEATLVSMVNSENVADRVYAYYKGGKVVKVNMVVENERPGDKVSFIDPDGNPVKGYIKSMDINMSSTLKGAIEVVTGYTPTGIGNFYQYSKLFTRDGTFTVPVGVYKIRLVLIGGGAGGCSGCPGESGTSEGMGAASYTGGKGGEGGDPGAGGAGGKILVVTLDVIPGQVLAIKIGKGGVGGVCDGNGSVAGAEGGATTCGGYTSANGAVSPIGYVNILTKQTFGTPGYRGNYSGCKGSGSDGPGGTISGDTITDGIFEYGPGAQGQGSDLTGSDWEAHAGGGYGGGAAYGSDGADGRNGSTRSNNGYGFAQGGAGGDGAKGAAGADAKTPGAGGEGGNGGGGGGGGGYAYHTDKSYCASGVAGKGGLGGEGGRGADGAALVFY